MGILINDDSGGDVGYLDSSSALHDPRQQARVLYPLPEILLLCLCAVLGGADSWVEVALYGQQKLEFLRRLDHRTIRPLQPFSMGSR